MAEFLRKIYHNLERFSNKSAFVINDQSFSYSDFSNRIQIIQSRILSDTTQQSYAVMCLNHIDTYASILALWFSGKTFVPLNSSYPVSRNTKIINLSGCTTVISAESLVEYGDFTTIITSELQENSTDKPQLKLDTAVTNSNIYILFTSGSTGEPKGVPVSYSNFQAFIDASLSTGLSFSDDDRFLQMYDLTFDGSFQSYIVPLLFGASVHTLDDSMVKYMAVAKILTTHNITVAKMTPSVLFYLQTWFCQISLPDLKYSIFGGEALPYALVKDWMRCVSNAEIVNVYGPSETTVNVLSYGFKAMAEPLEKNGVISIGKPHPGIDCVIINHEEGDDYCGELCISGKQVFGGYLNHANDTSFIKKNAKRYYKTGDVVYRDENGYYYFKCRVDSQVQINGFRVELTEIEAMVKTHFSCNSVACPVGQQKNMYSGILLYVESELLDSKSIDRILKNELPEYMQPAKIVFLPHLPLLSSGKVDRVALIQEAERVNNQQQ